MCVACCAVQEDPSQFWRQLVGRAAPAFQTVSAAVLPGAWRPFKLQASWLLLLLACKNPSNRQMLSRVERTTLLPLAMQLENAERFQQQAAAAEAAAAARTAAATAGAAIPQQQQQQLSRQGSAPDTPTGSRRSSRTSDGGSSSGVLSRGGSLPVSRKASVLAPVSSGGRLSSQGSGGVMGGVSMGPAGGSYDGEDELAMLQQEVALFGMVSSRGSSAEASGPGAAAAAQEPQQK